MPDKSPRHSRNAHRTGLRHQRPCFIAEALEARWLLCTEGVTDNDDDPSMHSVLINPVTGMEERFHEVGHTKSTSAPAGARKGAVAVAAAVGLTTTPQT